MSASMPLLSLKGITKIFPGVRALENVQLDLWPGKVTALIGENGAGKSTREMASSKPPTLAPNRQPRS